MSKKRYTEEFKIEAVRQVTERGYSVAEVAGRLGMTTHSSNMPVRSPCHLLEVHPAATTRGVTDRDRNGRSLTND